MTIRKELIDEILKDYEKPEDLLGNDGLLNELKKAIFERALEVFSEKWDGKYPTISESWRRNWQGIIPFLAYPDYIRKAIYTTNTIESINRSFRKVTKNRGAFPSDTSAMKLLYLALQNMEKKWTRPIRDWTMALNQFSILFGDRLRIHG